MLSSLSQPLRAELLQLAAARLLRRKHKLDHPTRLQVPLSTMAHSAALCQCSSRTPPGLSSNSAPAMLVALMLLLVLALKRPPGNTCQGCLLNCSTYCSSN